MGFLDKAKELAAKAEEAVNQLGATTPQSEAAPLFRDLGAKVFERESGRGTPDTDNEIAQLIERLTALEAQSGQRLITVAESLRAATPPPPPGGVAAPPPPGTSSSGAAPGVAPPPPAPQPPAAPATPPPPPPPPPAGSL